jgi:geranylgeranyl diphosphate synthase, type III
MIKTKGYNGEDIHEGKITLMVIHHLKHGSTSSKERLLKILKMKTSDPALIQEAIDILNQSHSLDYAKKRMYELVDEANKNLDQHF